MLRRQQGTGRELTRRVDPVEDSLTHLLAISFGKSSSPSYPLAVNVAQGATKYAELEIAGKPVHFVAFARTREDAARARTILDYVSGWKTTQIFAGGKLIQDRWSVVQVLNCYLEASACNDRTAHCHRVIDDPYLKGGELGGRGLSLKIQVSLDPEPLKKEVRIDRYIFPCSFLQNRFRFQVDHPASPQDQIQAEAVKVGCDWCPYFDPTAYHKVGTRTIYESVFE